MNITDYRDMERKSKSIQYIDINISKKGISISGIDYIKFKDIKNSFLIRIEQDYKESFGYQLANILSMFLCNNSTDICQLRSLEYQLLKLKELNEKEVK